MDKRFVKVVVWVAVVMLFGFSLAYATLVKDSALRRVKKTSVSEESPSFIPATSPSSLWQPRHLDKPMKIALYIPQLTPGSETAKLVDTLFKLQEGNRDIEISGIYGGYYGGHGPARLADYLRTNPEHGSWHDTKISYGSDWIEINGQRISYIPILEISSLPWEDTSLNAIILAVEDIAWMSKGDPDAVAMVNRFVKEDGPRAIFALGTELAHIGSFSDNRISITKDGKYTALGRPIVIGLNDTPQLLKEKILTLMPSVDLSGLGILLKGLTSSFNLTDIHSIRVDEPQDGIDIEVKPSVTTSLLHSMLPQLKLSGKTELVIDRVGIEVPRGGKHVAITFSVDKNVSAEDVNMALQRLAGGELKGILVVSDKDDILSSSYFIETESERTYVGPSFVVDSRVTSVIMEDKEAKTGKIVMLHGWVSDYAGGRSIQDLLVKLGLADPEIGAVSPSEVNITPEGSALIAPSVPGPIEKKLTQPVKIAINGAGRIGRILLRLMVGNPNLNVVAINDLIMDVRQLAHLIEVDTAQGRLKAQVEYGMDGFEKAGDGIPWISINGKKIAALKMKDNLPWAKMGIDTVIEATGVFTHTDKASQHLNWGAKRVVVSAPPDKTDTTMISFVPGVNDHFLKEKGFPDIFSVSSCTSNNVSATLIVLEKEFQKLRAQGKNITFKAVTMDTIHAITPTQNLMDNFGRSDDRMLSAQENAILTTSGAAKEVPKLIPALKDKMIVGAVRVGNQAGSVSALTIVLDQNSPYTAEEWLRIYREASQTYLKGILKVSDLGRIMTSGDIVGIRETAVVDPVKFEVWGNTIKIYTWYDNEVGFSTNLLEAIVRYALMKP